MSLEFYKILHLAGLMALFLGLGGVLALQGNGNQPSRKLVAIFHGIGLLLLLVGGFGMIAKLQIGFPVWTIVKLIIWVLLGGMLVLGKRRVFSPGVVWILAIALGITAAWFGLRKPFHTSPVIEPAQAEVR